MLALHKLKKVRFCFFAVLAMAISQPVWSQHAPSPARSPEQKAARYFESVRNQPSLLHEFLKQMPKRGDLHNHLSGAVYAESFIKFAVQDGLCVDRNTLSLLAPPCDAANGKPAASSAYQDAGLYGRMLDAFSMRQFHSGPESGHDHFFATFGKFGAATNNHTAEMLAEVRERAAAGHLLYMELMFNPDGGAAARLGAQLGWNDDLNKMREQLLSGGLPQIITDASRFLDETAKKENEELRSGQPEADAGWAVKARYLSQVERAF